MEQSQHPGTGNTNINEERFDERTEERKLQSDVVIPQPQEGQNTEEDKDHIGEFLVEQFLKKDTLKSDRKIYHFTHINNLRKILQSGYLQSRNGLINQGVHIKDISNNDVQNRRIHKDIPFFQNKVVHDFVPFYFTVSHPMAYELFTKKRSEFIQYVFFETSTSKFTIGEYAFTDKNASKYDANFYNDFVKDYQNLDWQEIDNQWWVKDKNSPKKGKKQAEFLVLDKVPLNLIEKIIVLNTETRSFYYPYCTPDLVSIPLDVDLGQKQLQIYLNSFDSHRRRFKIKMSVSNNPETKALLALLRAELEVLITYSCDLSNLNIDEIKKYINNESVKEIKFQLQQNRISGFTAKLKKINPESPSASSELKELFYNPPQEKITQLSQIIKRETKLRINMSGQRLNPELFKILEENEVLEVIDKKNQSRSDIYFNLVTRISEANKAVSNPQNEHIPRAD